MVGLVYTVLIRVLCVSVTEQNDLYVVCLKCTLIKKPVRIQSVQYSYASDNLMYVIRIDWRYDKPLVTFVEYDHTV